MFALAALFFFLAMLANGDFPILTGVFIVIAAEFVYLEISA